MNFYNRLMCFFLLVLSQNAIAQSMYSFEGDKVPTEWTVDNSSKLSISNLHFKDSINSLRWDWNAKSVITINNFKGLKENSKNRESCFWGWVYNASPKNDSIKYVFTDESGVEQAHFYYNINFKGWRCIWICFARDLGFNYSKVGKPLNNVQIIAPKSGNGSLYFDMVETRLTTGLNWHRSSNKQYKVGEANAEWRNLAYDFEPSESNIDVKDIAVVDKIQNNLLKWLVGDDNAYANNKIYIARKLAVEKSITNSKVARWAIIKKLKFKTTNDGIATTVVADTLDAVSKKYFGVGLHGDMTGYGYLFTDVNNGFLFNMAMSVARYKGNDVALKNRMLDSVTKIMDWMYDQGYAEGSGLGTGITQLRSGGFPYAFFMIHELINDNERYDRYMKAIRWIARDTYSPDKKGASADEIRASMISKLIYACCLKDERKRLAEMQYFKEIVENSIAIAPGYFGLIKPDYSVYHHTFAYYSEYGDDAIHQTAVVLYLLRDTKYSLSTSGYNNIRNAVMNLTDVSSNYVVPSSVSGRFPCNGRNITELLPALAYVGLSAPIGTKRDVDLEKAFVRLYRNKKDDPSIVGMDGSAMAIQYSQSLGAAMALVAYDAMVPENQNGAYNLTKFLPFSGLYVTKYNDWSLSVKGFGKYIIDFECITTNGRYSRYNSYGNTQLMSESRNWNSYTCSQGFDYTHYPGTTCISLPLAKIDTRGDGNNKKERNYGDEPFVGGVALNDTIGMTSFKLHDNTFNKSCRAIKSVFSFGNLIYFMGSNIENNDNQNETHTTIFQNIAGKDLQLNGSNIKGVKSATIDNDISILKNSWNNTYIVYPQSGTQLQVEKRMQNNPDPDGKKLANGVEHEIAWLNHGHNPSGKKYNYALLLNEDATAQAQLTNNSHPLIKVLQQDSVAHIIQTNLNGKDIVGYAIFQSNDYKQNNGLIKSVSQPCIVMLSTSKSIVELTLSNPDLNRPVCSISSFNTPGTIITTEIVLTNKYLIEKAETGVSIKSMDDGTTKLIFQCLNGASYKVSLKRVNE